jgi:quercetin dioxygenase-like cupin family protein
MRRQSYKLVEGEKRTMTTAAADHSPIIRASDDGERRWSYGGGVHTWNVRPDEVGEAFMLFEDQMAEGKMTPLHTHPDSDETMHVLEGEILTHMDGVEE